MTSASIDATTAAELFLAGARDGGLGHVCISPGSRSTPLAVAATRIEGITTSVHLDERVASFSALGRSLASGVPTALICTSGTAGANYLPAIAEANMSNVPLIAITADRPPEHWSWGVGQTFTQQGLYHRQVRAEFSMPVGGDGGREFSSRAGWRAACTSTEEHGPVHVNWPFRLPLEPQFPAEAAPIRFAPPEPESELRTGEVERLATLLASSQAPLLIAGPGALRAPGVGLCGDGATDSRSALVHDAAKRAGLPIVADSLSGLRGADAAGLVPAGALVFQRPAEVLEPLAPDLMIHMGQTPTAKATRLWWETRSATHVLLDPNSDWNDPSHMADHRFTSDPVGLLSAASADLDESGAWRDGWVAVGAETAKIRDSVLSDSSAVTDAHVAAEFEAALGNDDHLFTSSSMPVRDVDTFAPVTSSTRVHANRGINGIDGVISTASGFAASSTRAVSVLIGDVALLHDVGGVLDAARNGQRLVIAVPNNDGGGIFSLLPAKTALAPDDFEQLFNTPHGSTFDFLGHYPNISHEHVTDVGAAVKDAHDDPKSTVTILEVAVSTQDRLTFQQDLLDRLSRP